MGTKQEGGDPCYSAALPDEPMFVLLARDATAPDLVRAWANKREARTDSEYPTWGMVNAETPTVPKSDTELAERVKIAEARYTAARMEVWRYENDGKWRA